MRASRQAACAGTETPSAMWGQRRLQGKRTDRDHAFFCASPYKKIYIYIPVNRLKKKKETKKC